MYINNIPSSVGGMHAGDGKAPDGTQIFKPYRGIIPGIMFDAMEMIPTDIYQAFGDSVQECVNPTLKIVGQDSDGKLIKSTESRLISKADAMKIDPCAFPSDKNPYAPKGRDTCVKTVEEANALLAQKAAEGMRNMSRDNKIPNDD